jgi:hemolysin III
MEFIPSGVGSGWEPFSTSSHGIGALLALGATARLRRRSRGDPALRSSLTLFGLAMFGCFSASSLYHGARWDPALTGRLLLLDRICIFGLIAGTITPLARHALAGWWRTGGLAWAWSFAGIGSVAWLGLEEVPPTLATVLYLTMGWGTVILVAQAARGLPAGATAGIVGGGLFYTVGAACDLLLWPVLVPGAIASHEVFHLFVLAGAGCHYAVMSRYLIPAAPAIAATEAAPIRRDGPEPFPRPHLRRARSPRREKARP